MKLRKIYFWLFILVVLTPLGVMASGSAWGEWASEEVKAQVGFVPKGMKTLENTWSGFLSGYNVAGFNGKFLEAVGYIASAVVGIGIIFLIFKLIERILPDEPKKQGGN